MIEKLVVQSSAMLEKDAKKEKVPNRSVGIRLLVKITIFNYYISGDVTKGELGVTAVPGKENEFKVDFNTTVQYAKAVNAKKIHIMAGKLAHSSQNNWDTYENNLKYAADVLKTENLLGVIEPINQYSVPQYFLSDFNKGNYESQVLMFRGSLRSAILCVGTHYT